MIWWRNGYSGIQYLMKVESDLGDLGDVRDQGDEDDVGDVGDLGY